MRFDKEASLWDEKPRRVELGKKVSEYVNKHILKDSKILDFGCGTGLVSLNLCEKSNEIIGIDLSCEMINIYNKKVKILNCKAKGLCEDVNNLNQKFDVIVASMVFHHIKNTIEILEILSQKLNLNGQLFIADLCEEDGTFHENGNDDVFHFGFTKEKLEHNHFIMEDFSQIYTIKKQKNFKVFICTLKKVV